MVKLTAVKIYKPCRASLRWPGWGTSPLNSQRGEGLAQGPSSRLDSHRNLPISAPHLPGPFYPQPSSTLSVWGLPLSRSPQPPEGETEPWRAEVTDQSQLQSGKVKGQCLHFTIEDSDDRRGPGVCLGHTAAFDDALMGPEPAPLQSPQHLVCGLWIWLSGGGAEEGSVPNSTGSQLPEGTRWGLTPPGPGIEKFKVAAAEH